VSTAFFQVWSENIDAADQKLPTAFRIYAEEHLTWPGELPGKRLQGQLLEQPSRNGNGNPFHSKKSIDLRIVWI
jgi:hypothetical protein